MGTSIWGHQDQNPFPVYSASVIFEYSTLSRIKLHFRAILQRCWAFLSVVFPKLGKSRRVLPFQSGTQYPCQSETGRKETETSLLFPSIWYREGKSFVGATDVLIRVFSFVKRGPTVCTFNAQNLEWGILIYSPNLRVSSAANSQNRVW